ncbi:multicopper oxidase-domain-containing protein [Aspergillus avenaceus]|uniref:Multicopper oxidase-domain-containing protein n=1 Tax=Aspergillus avenaceus TaxID=36643 RepID=A0A5N6TL46_ASPAV|nr:multicopper oxidase-domain-containing protein [Aspergillus avenaceus]
MIVCTAILLIFLREFTLPDPLRLRVSSPEILSKHGIDTHLPNPDASRPVIELHQDDHVYRDPMTQYLDWVVTADLLRPDGVLKKVYLINGMFPGPSIEARSGDTLIINVTNALQDESISIHWHGLHIHNKMDGVPGVTQYAISPGSTFTYNLTIPDDQSGTFWYHGHSGTSRADGLYGGFIVHAPSSHTSSRKAIDHKASPALHSYKKDFLLLIGDWYHRSGDQVLAWYMRPGSFGNEPVPDSLLVNGEGHFNCSMAVPARPVDCIERQTNLSYLSNVATYRLRIVNTGSLAGLTLQFPNTTTLIQIDSNDIEPLQSPSIGILHPGQRIDILTSSNPLTSLTIHLDQKQHINRSFNLPNPALSPTHTFPISNTHNTIPHPKDTIDILSKIPSAQSLAKPPLTPPETHVLYTKVQKLSINHNIPYGFFNHTSWRPQSTPLTTVPTTEWDDNQLAVTTAPGTWVDLIVNNLDEGGHPFHLHGHSFYVMHVYEASQGWGSYNPSTDVIPPGLESQSYNLSRAMLRDTIYVPSRGYAVLRFRADNPGVWLFHCHILWHWASGMAMLVHVGGGA